jgi:multiple sugar transport system ATP-binding protein
MEELGAEHIVHLTVDATRVDSGDPDAIKELNSRSNLVARIEARSTMKPSTDIHLAIDADRLHFFHPETHMAI